MAVLHTETYIFFEVTVPSHTPVRTVSWFKHIHKNEQKPATFVVRPKALVECTIVSVMRPWT